MPILAAAASAIVLAAGGLLAEGTAWSVTNGHIRVVCPLTVGGTFEAKTAALMGTLTLSEASPATFAGDLSVDLRTLETGISVRDAHLREYLEVDRSGDFAFAILSGIRLGDVATEALRGEIAFAGVLLLRGVRRKVGGRAKIRREGPRIHVEASFPVKLSEYGIREPVYLGVGVRDTVLVKVTLKMVPALEPGAAR